MTTRRNFLKTGSLSLAGLLIGETVYPAVTSSDVSKPHSSSTANTYVSLRPAPGERKFSSKIVDETIAAYKKRIKDTKLAWMFENCYPNTLDTTCEYAVKNGRPDSFIITGDIHAMWLRDSSAQVYPYVVLAKKEKALQDMLAGVINRQTECILIDPYANAFNNGPLGSEWESDHTEMKKELHERKWEIDSLCYPIRLAYHYWKETGDTSVFGDRWVAAIEAILKTFKEQQRKDSLGPYRFARTTDRQGDTLLNDGWGSPVNPVGLIVSSFRPSDDASLFGFLVPSNLFAVTSLRQAAEMLRKIKRNDSLAGRCEALANEVEAAINKYAIVEREGFGKVYAYEVDGFGNYVCMDDANVPSLLALPFLGCIDVNDPVYQNTRRLVLSKSNPYFFKGKAGEGIGGPHIGFDFIWPMSIIMRAATSRDEEEIRYCIQTLRDTDGGTGFMHESFHKDDPSDFTRKWFAWANTLFGELIIKLTDQGKLKDFFH
ncbi:MAG: glycoside hydrolase family 125 protein [Tannerellaceae bacterium]|jgi:meiotically up-regulated gene 157 (Mug157) protein|nr:glycoside hydrolase family 125 protein [Tannerellaceae bacterium]